MKGGGYKKEKPGRKQSIPSDLAYNHRADDIFSDMHSGLVQYSTQNLEILGLTEMQKSQFICTICREIFSARSVQTPCEHYFCTECLSSVFVNNLTNTVPCPVCKTSVEYGHVKVAGLRFTVQLSELQVRCTLCSSVESLENIQNHSCNVPGNPNTSSISTDTHSAGNLVSPEKCKVKEIQIQTSPINMYATITQRNINSPLSKTEQHLQTSLARRSLTQSNDDTIHLKTGGQVSQL